MKKRKKEKLKITSEVTAPKGMFTANLEGKQYEVAIECSYFEEDYFKFQSDITDSNGDGLIISGFQRDKKLVLTIIDGGKKFSAANIKFTKTNNSASGGGKLFEEGGAVKGLEVSFKVTCK